MGAGEKKKQPRTVQSIETKYKDRNSPPDKSNYKKKKRARLANYRIPPQTLQESHFPRKES